MPATRYNAVLWDIDGTLVDSEPLHLQALLSVCKRWQVDISHLSDSEFVGVSLYGVWDRLKELFPATLTRENWISEIDDSYRQGASTLQSIPNAAEVISELDGLGIRQAAVSNSGRAIVDVNLDAIGVTKFMEFSLSLDDVLQGKPSPTPYLMGLERLGLRARDVLAVEDSLSGVQSAKAAGISVASLNNPSLSASFTIKDLEALLH